MKVVEDKVDDEVTTVHDIQVEEDATPPAAPDGVELYESSPDEITVMTERTMELLDVREEDDELAAREELVATSEFQAQTEGESTSQVDESDHPEREEVLEELLETAEFEREQIVSQFSEPAADEKLDPAEETDDDAQPHVDELRITDELTDEEVESLQKLRAQQREKMALDQHCDEVVASGDDSTASSKPSGDEISEVDDGADDDSLRENESIVELTEMPPPSPTTSYKVGDCISGGYDVPLPFAVEPWKDDVWKVVKAPRASVEKKDLMFPYPQQKHKGEVVVRGFGEEPPSTPAQERSLVVVMMAIALIFVMIVVGVSFF